ncbi:MAG TPA: hypothetical protein VF952_15615 [Chloroflexia bacterium]|jgi:hypothetical protein
MASLRRISLPLKGTERLRRAVFKPRPPRLGKAERKMEEALNQLRSGVPLNWLQMEDDPELVTLARLYSVARHAPRPGLEALPPRLQEDTLDRLSKRLPAPKPQPLKQAPTSLAGFSENVTVLTQAEEDLPPLVTTAPQMAVALFVTTLVVTLLAVAYNTFFPAPKSPYTWIEVRENGRVVATSNLPIGYKAPVCPASVVTNTVPYVIRNYIGAFDEHKAQEKVDFPIEYLPTLMTVGSTDYGLGLIEAAIGACDEFGETAYSNVRLNYLVTMSTPGQRFRSTQLYVFQSRQQVVPVEKTNGIFKDVTLGVHKGVFWEGEFYRDYSGVYWSGRGTISVLALEKGDLVTTFVGQADRGITEEMLLALARKMYGVAAPTATPEAAVTGTPSSNGTRPANRRTSR